MTSLSRHSKAVMAAGDAIALAGVVWVYFSFDPSSYLFPRCMFLTITGLQCPGCGSQRALHALLHGDIAAAWAHNALLLIELPLIAALVVAWRLRRRYPALHRALNSRSLIITLLTVIILWTIVRNIAI